MISIVLDYLTAFFIVQLCLIPLFSGFIFWTKKYSNFKIQNRFLHFLIIAGLILPSFFMIPVDDEALSENKSIPSDKYFCRGIIVYTKILDTS